MENKTEWWEDEGFWNDEEDYDSEPDGYECFTCNNTQATRTGFGCDCCGCQSLEEFWF